MWRMVGAPTTGEDATDGAEDDGAEQAAAFATPGTTRPSLARRLARGLVDRLLPPCCPLCRSLTADGGALCAACWSTIRFIERPYCERLGTPFPFDLGEGTLSAGAIADPPAYDRARAVARFEGAGRDLVHMLKYDDHVELARLMAPMMVRAGRDLLAGRPLLLPVPLHPTRLWRRRFNQSALLAREIARLSALPCDTGLLRRTRRTPRQVGLDRKGRADNVRGAFALAKPERLRGRDVLLVDDVLTTGATVEAATRTLRRAGAARVDVLVFARVVGDGAS